MPVATFEQTDFETQSGTEYKTAIDGDVAVMARLAASFAPHEQSTPNMTVRVDAGDLFVNGALVQKAAQNTGAITAPTVNPRIDRVVIDALTGVVSVVTGAEAGSPVPPAIPAGKLPVCQVALATTTTAIDNSLLTDERVPAAGGGLELASDGEAEARIVTDKAVAPSQLTFGGGLVLQERQTVSNAVSATFSGLSPGKYKLLVRVIHNGTGYKHALRFNADTGNNYGYQYIRQYSSTIIESFYSTGVPAIPLADAAYPPQNAFEVWSEIEIATWWGNDQKVRVRGNIAYSYDSAYGVALTLIGKWYGAAALSSITYLVESAATMTGELLLYKYMDD